MVVSTFQIILIAGITATSAMTLFSQLVSKLRKNEFNEAQLLTKFILRTKLFPKASILNTFLGWIIHYSIGLILAALMYFVFWYSNLETTILNGGFLGLVAGLIGALFWMVLFTFHSNPPKTAVNEFVMQLLVAHFIFGITSTIFFN